MAFYKIGFQIRPDGVYVYPPAIAGVVWQRTWHHPVEPSMVGESGESLTIDGRSIESLTEAQAMALQAEWQAPGPATPAIDDRLRAALAVSGRAAAPTPAPRKAVRAVKKTTATAKSPPRKGG